MLFVTPVHAQDHSSSENWYYFLIGSASVSFVG
jgi:hypothetical protein